MRNKLPFYCIECGQDFDSKNSVWTHDCDKKDAKKKAKKDTIKFGQEIGVAVGLSE